jgi:tRNA(Arg) A34 adenosine deaminase TadA
VDNTAMSDWSGLSAAWREAFTLAWEAFVERSPPVGAVVVASDGSVVSRGRSRRGEASGPSGQLAGSRLSHAEVNALAGTPVGRWPDHVLYVTLEPCFLCAAAVAMSHVGSVWFAGEDPVWRFVSALGDFHPMLRDRWYRQRGPMPGPFGAWAALLPLIERLARDPTGPRVEAFEMSAPTLVTLATEIAAADQLRDFMGLSLTEALSEVWSTLSAEPTSTT